MSQRLPPQPHEWIDRTAPVCFSFEGQSVEGYIGDTLSSALWAAGMRMTGRSFKYHRPRGPYSFANHDAATMVQEPGGSPTQLINARGDTTPVATGLNVHAVNTWGGLAHDRYNVIERFSRFLPVGFYYKTFFRPAWAFPIHERQMRKAAGLGRLAPDARTPPSPKDYGFCELLIIGGGPSGISAAIAAAEAGARVCLVDENPHLGGSLNWQYLDKDDTALARPLREGIARLQRHDNVELRLGTVAGGWYADHWVGLFNDKRLTKMRAKATLMAGGCIEQPAVFGNNDLPGVMLASAAQRLMRQFAVQPFKRAVVLAGNDEGYRVALDLIDTGIEVMAVVDLRHRNTPAGLAGRVRDRGIEVLVGHGIDEVIASCDKVGVAGVRIGTVVGEGQLDRNHLRQIDCDGVAVSVGWMPAAGLLYQAGVRFGYDSALEQLVPVNQPAGVFAAGRVRGVFTLRDRIADGRCAGLCAASYLGHDTVEPPARPRHLGTPSSHPYPIFPHPGKKNFVDFDEDLHLQDFLNAHQEGYDNIELMKRYSTVGMGPTQGKLSNMNAVRILAKLNGASIDETGTTTSRPFYHPAKIKHLAGRRFHPIQRTSLHDWHVEHDAQFIHAGSWLRPEYYRRSGVAREDRIFDEAQHVRASLGLIDVGTLGKLQVCGPDAVAFLERLYAGKLSSLAVGKYRYGIALDESGVLIEDGVIARLAEDRFYVTATSSGAAAFYREMLRWAMIWGMCVTILPLTSQHAAMNIAGPHSRVALTKMTDLELSSEAFPYLGVREAEVAGVPAIVMRVGFVGELGYEVHVPASMGDHVWRELMRAGAQHDIRPFGLEAQRLLRLEKGHLIVSHDTDALTQPLEADLGWAVSKKKDDWFVGERSLEAMAKQEPQRRLVGIRWDEGYSGPLPEENQLVIHKGAIAGRVTSIARRSTLGYPLGLAFVLPELSTPDTPITIRIGRRSSTHAAVTRLPFYDPHNQRQKV